MVGARTCCLYFHCCASTGLVGCTCLIQPAGQSTQPNTAPTNHAAHLHHGHWLFQAVPLEGQHTRPRQTQQLLQLACRQQKAAQEWVRLTKASMPALGAAAELHWQSFQASGVKLVSNKCVPCAARRGSCTTAVRCHHDHNNTCHQKLAPQAVMLMQCRHELASPCSTRATTNRLSLSSARSYCGLDRAAV